MSGSSAASTTEYSRAFETFVGAEDDLLGMLAYALYKRGIREARQAGRTALTGEHRNPSDAERMAFRSLAAQMLDDFATSAQESAREAILDGGLRPDLANLKSELLTHIDMRTAWWPAFLVN